LKVPVSLMESGKGACPACGAQIKRNDESPLPFEAGETQTVSIKEMARMAQDGLDVSTSGEWDTAGTAQPRGKKGSKK
jgi:hypothetical protein